MKNYINKIGITFPGEIIDEAYVVVIPTSNDYGKVYSKLEKTEDLYMMDENQLITEDGGSIMFESESEPFILNLMADFKNDIYQLVVTEV